MAEMLQADRGNAVDLGAMDKEITQELADLGHDDKLPSRFMSDDRTAAAVANSKENLGMASTVAVALVATPAAAMVVEAVKMASSLFSTKKSDGMFQEAPSKQSQEQERNKVAPSVSKGPSLSMPGENKFKGKKNGTSLQAQTKNEGLFSLLAIQSQSANDWGNPKVTKGLKAKDAPTQKRIKELLANRMAVRREMETGPTINHHSSIQSEEVLQKLKNNSGNIMQRLDVYADDSVKVQGKVVKGTETPTDIKAKQQALEAKSAPQAAASAPPAPSAPAKA